MDVDYERGMGVSIGRLREDSMYDFKFVGLSHNTVRGAAGGTVLCAETSDSKRLYHKEIKVESVYGQIIVYCGETKCRKGVLQRHCS